MNRNLKVPVMKSLLMTSVCLIASPAMAAAQTSHNFDIPSESVAKSLQDFGRQAGKQIVFPYDGLTGRTAPAIVGVQDDAVVLSRLARIAGLVVARNDGKVIALTNRANLAPEQPAAATGAGSDSAVTPDIIVTARKQSESITRTPLAVSAMSGEDLKRLGVTTLDSIGEVAPNIVIDRGAGQTGIDIVLRGVGDNGQGQTQTPGIGVILDGVQILDTRALIVPFFDLDHIEVLRGPQGTLYGAASPGGVIKVVSARPTFDLGAKADLEVANFNSKRGNFVINAPLSDKLAARLALNFNDRDGYIIQSDTTQAVDGRTGAPVGPGTKALDAEHDWSARGSLLYKASADTTFLLSATVQHSYNSPFSSVPYADFTSANSGVAQRTAPNNPLTPNTNDWFYNVNLDVTSRLGPVAAELTAGYSYVKFDDLTVDNGGVIPPGGPGWIAGLAGGHDNNYSAELRLHNAEAGKLEWTAGVSYLGVRSLVTNGGVSAPCVNDPGTCFFGNNTQGEAPTFAQTYISNGTLNDIQRNSTGLYGTLQYHLLPTLELTAGARESFDDIAQQAHTFNYLVNPFWFAGPPGSTPNVAQSFAADPCTGPTFLTNPLCYGEAGVVEAGYNQGQAGTYGDVTSNLSYHANKFTWKVGVDWKPAEGQLIYANISTGYKPGGFNPPSGYTNAPCCFKAENLIAYEIGYKGRLTPWLRLDSDFFYYDYKDQQVVSQFSLGQANFTQATINTPTRIYGTENQAVVTPTRFDALTLSVNYLHTEFVDLFSGGNAGNPYISWAGHVLDKSPSWTLGGAYRHRFDLGSHGMINFNAVTHFTSQYFINVISNSQTYRQAPFTRSNADLTYVAPGDRFSIQVFVKNIENRVEETFYQGNPFQPGNGNVGINEPRFYGVRLGAKF